MTHQNTEVQDMNNVINNAKLEAVQVEGHHPFMVRHDEMNIDGLEAYAEKPYRARANETFNTVKAMAQYVKDFKGEATRHFANLRDQSLKTIFDYHTPNGDAGFRDHVAKLELSLDPDYERLVRMSGSWKSQSDFVKFMYDYAAMLTGITRKAGGELTPMSKAEFIELIKEIKAVSTEETSSGASTSSTYGQSNYANKVTTADGEELPESLTISLPVFLGEENVDHVFRLEADKDGSRVNMRLILVRPEKVREEAFVALATAFAEQAEVTVYGL